MLKYNIYLLLILYLLIFLNHIYSKEWCHRYYISKHCDNPAHFVTEVLPNYLKYNSLKPCFELAYTNNTKKITFDLLDKKYLVNVDSDIPPEEYKNQSYMGFLLGHSWANTVLNSELYDYYWIGKAINYVRNKCNLSILNDHTNSLYDDVPVDIYKSIGIVQRDTRPIENIEILEAKLNEKNLKISYITPKDIIDQTQCNILSLFNKYDLIITVYGAELIYPIILNKPYIGLLNNQKNIGFFQYLSSGLLHLNGFSVPPYKIIRVPIYNELKSRSHLIACKRLNRLTWHKCYSLYLTDQQIKTIVNFLT